MSLKRQAVKNVRNQVLLGSILQSFDNSETNGDPPIDTVWISLFDSDLPV